MIEKKILIALMFVFLSACSVEGVSPKSLPQEETVSRTSTIVGLTSTAFQFDQNVIPESTPTNFLLKKPTITFTPTAFPTNTATPMPPGMVYVDGFILQGASPDKTWFWGNDQTGYHDDNSDFSYTKTVFVSADGKLVWTIWPKSQDVGIIDADFIYYKPIFWLPSEPYVYLGGNFCCWDGPYGFTGMNLARLDLRSGEFSIQIAGWSPHHFSFSENGKYFMDTQYKVPRLRFIRLRDSATTDIPIDPIYVHNVMAAFSPDQNSAIVQACQESPGIGLWGCSIYSLLFVDIEEGTYRILVPDLVQEMQISIEEFYSFTYSWPNEDDFYINSVGHNNLTHRFVLDLYSGRVTEVK